MKDRLAYSPKESKLIFKLSLSTSNSSTSGLYESVKNKQDLAFRYK